jgi:MFS superfamily sulfate permease-like transporter
MNSVFLTGMAAFMTVFWLYLTVTLDEHWRRNSAMTFAFATLAVGNYFDHDMMIGVAMGILLSLLGYIMWVGSPPHREHVREHADRYEID